MVLVGATHTHQVSQAVFQLENLRFGAVYMYVCVLYVCAFAEVCTTIEVYAFACTFGCYVFVCMYTYMYVNFIIPSGRGGANPMPA